MSIFPHIIFQGYFILLHSLSLLLTNIRFNLFVNLALSALATPLLVDLFDTYVPELRVTSPGKDISHESKTDEDIYIHP